MYGLDASQLRINVVRPTLEYISLHSDSAENLVLGTALTESHGKYLRQIKGPALGLWQMEPATHDDIWDNWLKYKTSLTNSVAELMSPAQLTEGALELVGNLYYGAAMCRIFYRRLPDPLPAPDDFMAMARLWKNRYNTHLGRGTVAVAIPHFQTACKSKP